MSLAQRGSITVPFPEAVEPRVTSASAELRSWLASGERPASVGDIADDLTCILLGSDWPWPEFDAWHARFVAGRYFPPSWAGLEARPPDPPPGVMGRLVDFQGLSFEARRVYVRCGAVARKSVVTLSQYEIARKVPGMDPTLIDDALDELSEGGLASDTIPVREALAALKKADLQEVAAQSGVAAGGTKEQVLGRLLDQCSEADLARLLPDSGTTEVWHFVPIAGPEGGAWVDHELKRIRLLGWTVRNLPVNLGRAVSALSMGRLPAVQVQGQSCQECSSRDGALLSPDAQGNVSVPPFHPGCDCTVVTSDQPYRRMADPGAAKGGCATLLLACGFVCGAAWGWVAAMC